MKKAKVKYFSMRNTHIKRKLTFNTISLKRVKSQLAYSHRSAVVKSSCKNRSTSVSVVNSATLWVTENVKVSRLKRVINGQKKLLYKPGRLEIQ